MASSECKPNTVFVSVYKILTEISGSMIFPQSPYT